MSDKEFAVGRRTVLTAGGLVVAGGALAACGGSASTTTAIATPAAPAASAASGGTVAATGAPAGAIATSDIPLFGGVIVPEPPIVITQPSEGTYKAFTAICPHQGCLVGEVAENEIVCACHGSLFSAVDGSVIQGPAVQGLTEASIAVQGDSIALP
ncbi:MAG: Rieske (2Fe-2S) protein [Actinomycetota bacterium]|nr:Rieske (2Fe-2S) protein [Actinomycetota bacterium]